MVASLLAALVPSATLAARPVPTISRVSVAQYLDEGNGKCAVTVVAYFTGHAYAALFRQLKDGEPNSSPWTTVN